MQEEIEKILSFFQKEWFRVLLILLVAVFLFIYWMDHKRQVREYNWGLFKDIGKLCDETWRGDDPCVKNSYKSWEIPE